MVFLPDHQEREVSGEGLRLVYAGAFNQPGNVFRVADQSGQTRFLFGQIFARENFQDAVGPEDESECVGERLLEEFVSGEVEHAVIGITPYAIEKATGKIDHDFDTSFTIL